MLEAITFPEPVIRVAIEPKTKPDQDKMGIALGKLMDEDPTFRVNTDTETGQTIIAGMGELHLEVIVDRLMREYRVDANVGRPQVAYRETITQSSRARDPFKRQTGGRGMYGDVELKVEPLEPGSGVQFEWKIVGGTVPREYSTAVEAGVREALDGGVIANYPMVDVKVAAVDGSYHEVDSNEMAFKIAGSQTAQGGAAQGQSAASGTHDGGRGSHARRLLGRRHGRPEQSPRSDPGHGAARQRPGRARQGAAGRDVRVCD